MKKINLNLKMILLISVFFISSKNIYSQWIIAGDLAGIVGSRPQVSVVDENTAYVTGGLDINATYKTTNGGTDWIQLNTGAFQVFYAILAKDAVNVFAGDNGGGGAIRFYKSTNGGSTWTIIDSIPVAGASTSNFKQIKFSISNPNFGIAYAEGDSAVYIYKTRNGGNTWTRTLGPTITGYNASGGLNVIDSLFFAFGLAGNPPAIVITTDGGITWNLRSVNLPSVGFDITRGLAFKEDKLTGIAGTSSSDQFISRTSNGGLNWVNIDIGNTIINFLGPVMRWIEGTNICYLTVSYSTTSVINGVLKSTNGGLNWTAMTTSGLGFINMDTKRIGSNVYGYAITDDPIAPSGQQVLKVTDAIVGIYQISELVPDGYTLSQNYPNPFNPVTVIRYSLIGNRFATLKIYDILGNEVATLVNEKQNAGTYEVNFDGSNFSSGVYFYTLQTDNFSETKKMTLIK